MNHVIRWAALGLLSVLASQPGEAQREVCGGDYVCVAEEPSAAVVRLDPSPAVTRSTGFAGPEQCPGASVHVTAASAAERHLACSAAGDAVRLLGRCGISLRRPLDVQIMNEVRHPFRGAVFGFFDPRHERVFITHHAGIQALSKDTPYAALPQRDFYRSLIVHEVVHGVMHQNLKRPPRSHAAHEYPAYALQLESLPPQVRDTFLQSFDQAAIADKSLFNDPVLFLDPYFFAARAYSHFKASPDGCAHLTALLEGEVGFIMSPQM